MNLDPRHYNPLFTWALSELPWWTLAEERSPAGFITNTLHVPWTWLLHTRIIGPRAQSSYDKGRTCMINTKGITLYSRKCRNGSRARFYRLGAEGWRGRPEEGAPEWASPGLDVHQTPLHLTKACSQTQLCWVQRVNGAPPSRLKYAKVVSGPAAAEKGSLYKLW